MKNPLFTAREMAFVAVFVVIMSVLAQIAIPLQPVPLTFGTLGVILTATIIPVKLSVAVMITYMLLGAVGVPVFTQFMGGVHVLIGPTGGYIFGYIFMALVTGMLLRHTAPRGYPGILLATLPGLCALYTCGTVWLAFMLRLSPQAAILAGVAPFIPLELVKLAAGSFVALKVRAALARAKLLV